MGAVAVSYFAVTVLVVGPMVGVHFDQDPYETKTAKIVLWPIWLLLILIRGLRKL